MSIQIVIKYIIFRVGKNDAKELLHIVTRYLTRLFLNVSLKY